MPIDTSGETSEQPAVSPARPNEAEYFEWGPPESPVAIRMHLGAVDGIARDVIEGISTAPRGDCEVGGLLLGRVVTTERHLVWIERFQRISCEHSFGSHFILDAADTSALEHAATSIFETREMAVVGLYRSHTRPGLQLEESDFDLIRKYFSDPSDLVLLVKPGKGNNLFAQFYRFDTSGGAQPVGERFPFRGNVVTPDTRLVTPDTARTIVGEQINAGPENLSAPVADDSKAPTERPRRLVPDFLPSQVEPAPSVFGLSDPAGPDRWQQPDQTEEQPGSGGVKKWLPLVAALLLVGGIMWFLLQPGRNSVSPAPPTQAADSVRPLGLYVDPLAQTWRVLWNPNATALHDARSVQLFVREGDDQNRIELSPRDLSAGSYEYKPLGSDVTFRLEVTDKAGALSAESFRLVRSNASETAAAAPSPFAKGSSKPVGPQLTPPPLSPPRAQASLNSNPAPSAARNVQPRPIYRAPPVVAAGIRPRIKGTIPIDVKVRIDEKGRVVSASPITKLHNGLDEYLASRALAAAREWKFEPARDNGKAVAGTQTIHFVFTK
jgi:hypothetical protein